MTNADSPELCWAAVWALAHAFMVADDPKGFIRHFHFFTTL
jgi:hypothetical protein